MNSSVQRALKIVRHWPKWLQFVAIPWLLVLAVPYFAIPLLLSNIIIFAVVYDLSSRQVLQLKWPLIYVFSPQLSLFFISYSFILVGGLWYWIVVILAPRIR